MDAIAEEYVRLVLALGRHDPLYVDAYYGPPEWREEEASLDAIRARAVGARAELEGEASERGRWLAKQLDALVGRVDLVSGVPMTFDEESRALYDVVAPARGDEFYAEALDALEAPVPGEGPLAERWEAMRSRFLIPPDRLEAVFGAAIEAARSRTKGFVELPEGEEFRIEYVRDQVWGAYNWYQGGARSLIQVNTDSPLGIEGALHLACHEGYPGHHVYNALLEARLAKGMGWVEFTVYPLYSPQSLIAEGTAEYGVGLAFPEEERTAFEREVLAPLAGLDPEGLESYAEAREAAGRLRYASNDVGRRLLDGAISHEEAVAWFGRYGLLDPVRAERRVRFIEAHRSYVVTYNVGEDLVREYVEGRAATEGERWRVFTDLLSRPTVPSDLA